MEDVTRKRIMRMLERLPEEQLYQVLDYIEFLEVKYAREAGREPDAFQRFAERVEDQMRVRSIAPRALKGTMKIMSTANRLVDGVRDLGRDLTTPSPSRPDGREVEGRGEGRGRGREAVPAEGEEEASPSS